MLYQKEGIPFRKISTLCPAFCILFSAFLFLINTSSLSASEGRLIRQGGLELPTDSPIRRSVGAKEGPPQALLTLKQVQGTEGQVGWAATYGGVHDDCASSIQQTRDGGYIVAGKTGSSGAYALWVLKLRSDGTVEWQKTYGGVLSDWANSIQQTRDGGYVVAGCTSSFGVGGDFWVLKLQPDGAVEWQKTYGGVDWDWARSIQQTRDGGYIVAGRTKSFGAERGDFWVLKLQPDGTVEWQKTYGGASYDWAYAIQQTRDGGYIVAGWAWSFGGAYDFWVLKLRPDGAVEWQKTYGGDYDDWAYAIQQTHDGGYIVTGMMTTFLGAGGADLWVLKLRSDGTVEWQKTYGGVSSDFGNSIQQTRDGGYIVAGWTDSFGAGKEDVWVLKLRPDGTVEWQKTYGGVSYDRAYSIQQTHDGGYIVAGETESFGAGGEGSPDLLVLRLSPDGSIDPSCGFIRDTSISGEDSSATVKTASVNPENTNVNPQDSSATIQATDVSANILCPSTAVER